MYNLKEYNDNFAKTSPSLLAYCRNEPSNNITDAESFEFKLKLTDIRYCKRRNKSTIEILKVYNNWYKSLWSISNFINLR